MLAAHTSTYRTCSLEEALAGIAGAGFSFVELSAIPGWAEHVDIGEDPRGLQRLLGRYGLSAVSISAQSDLTSATGLAYGIAVARWAGEFGIPIVNTAVGGVLPKSEDEGAFLANADALADAADRAGVVIGLETKGDLTATGAKLRKLIEKVGRAAIRINYDTGNVRFYGGVEPVADLPTAVDYVVNCHLKDHIGSRGDWNFPPIGDGELDFGRIFEIFAAAGFQGPMAVEIEFEGEPVPPLPQLNEALVRSYTYVNTLIDPARGRSGT